MVCVQHCASLCGMMRHGMRATTCNNMVRHCVYNMVRHDTRIAWQCMARHSTALHGTSWHIMAHHGTTSHGTPWHVPTMRTMVCHDNAHPGTPHHDSCRIQKTHILELNLRSHGMRDGGKQTPENKDGGITISVWTMPQIASDCLSSVAHVPQHGKDETFLVTYVSHSDSIELVNLGFLSFFHPSCPSLPKHVQFSSCWQRLSDADLCHKGTCMHACMHAAAYSVTMRAVCFPTTLTFFGWTKRINPAHSNGQTSERCRCRCRC